MASVSFTSPFQTWHSRRNHLPFAYGDQDHCKPLDALFSFSGGSMFSSYSGRRMMFIQHREGKIVALASKPAKEAFAVEEEQMANARRIVVTGLGLVTPLGDEVDEFYDNLLQGVSGVGEIEAFNSTGFPTRIAAEVKSFSPDGWVSPRLSKRTEKNIIYTIASGKKALHHGGVTQEEIDKSRCGVVIGSAIGGLKMSCEGVEKSMISWKKVNPFTVPFTLIHMGSALLATELGWMGPNYAVSTACATSNSCIISAADHILRGEADMMLCGGSDSVITPLGLSGFVACGTLSRRNDDPTKASRPWDKNRDGFVMGEGAGVLLLEELEHAKRRGAKIYAEFLGGSSTNDAYDMIRPHPTGGGLILCMRRALARCGLTSNDINYINAHATSTVEGDSMELKALHQVFDGGSELRINATKSMTGHLMGGSGAVEAIAVVKAIETGWIHPNVNLEDTDDSPNWRALVGEEKERLDVKAAMSNSFGFGGHNACILFAPLK